jgi:hypothetical protein
MVLNAALDIWAFFTCHMLWCSVIGDCHHFGLLVTVTILRQHFAPFC